MSIGKEVFKNMCLRSSYATIEKMYQSQDRSLRYKMVKENVIYFTFLTLPYHQKFGIWSIELSGAKYRLIRCLGSTEDVVPVSINNVRNS